MEGVFNYRLAKVFTILTLIISFSAFGIASENKIPCLLAMDNLDNTESRVENPLSHFIFKSENDFKKQYSYQITKWTAEERILRPLQTYGDVRFRAMRLDEASLRSILTSGLLKSSARWDGDRSSIWAGTKEGLEVIPHYLFDPDITTIAFRKNFLATIFVLKSDMFPLPYAPPPLAVESYEDIPANQIIAIYALEADSKPDGELIKIWP